LARLRFLGEQANTMILFPAAILVLFGLGALAMESANLFLGTRRLTDLASAVANDAVGQLEQGAFYGSGLTELDAGAAASRGQGLIGLQTGTQDRSFEEVGCTITETTVIDGPLAVEVVCEATVWPILRPFWSGDDARRVAVTERATGVQSG
jgi:Flp pilus assembly protein TadG